MAWGWLKKAGGGVWKVGKFFLPFLVTAGLERVKEKNPKYAWLLDAIDIAVKEAGEKGWPTDERAIVRTILTTNPQASASVVGNLTSQYFKYVKR